MATQVTVTAQGETQYNVTINTGSEAQAEYWANQSAASAADALQSEQNAATSESNAQTSANNAATSESNAEDSASDSEKHAQEVAPFTDSDGVSFDKGAKGWSEDAEAARDEIISKIDFAGAEKDDILLRDDTEFKPKSIKDKDAWLLSAPAYYSYGQGSPGRLFAVDNFEVRGLSPSDELLGKTYGSSSAGLGGYLTLDTSNLNSNNSARNFKFFITHETFISSYVTSILLSKDTNNFIEVKFSSRNKIIVDETLAGVQTTLAIFNNAAVYGPERAIFTRHFFWDNRQQHLWIYDSEFNLTRVVQNALDSNGALNTIGIRNDNANLLSGRATILNYRIELK